MAEKPKMKLDRLNELLASTKGLNLPAFRSRVDASGANQQWLRKAMSRNENAPEELKALLALDFKILCKTPADPNPNPAPVSV